MVLDAVLSRFVEKTPITVMAQLTLQRALDPAWIESIFAAHRDRQYTRKLLFSTTVDLMSVVALGLAPSLHSAAKAREDLEASEAALYEKVNHTEPGVLRALVSGSAERLDPVVREIKGKGTSSLTLRGYRIRVLDGNHLPASEKRLKVLRSFRGAALPGHSLVVYDPDLALVVDMVPCEDAHAQERTLVPDIAQRARPGDLWISDRNFSTNSILCGWDERGAAFATREHASSPNPTECGGRRRVGRTTTGVVYEQAVQLSKPNGEILNLRRIELEIDQPTEDGEKVIRILTNLPKSVKGPEIADLYRRRWSIESMFQWLEGVLQSEIRSMGYPRASLFAFAVAVMAFNVLSVLQTAVERKHGLDVESESERQGEKNQIKLSPYYVVNEIQGNYGGMMIAVSDKQWDRHDKLSPQQLGRLLLEIAEYVKPATLRKHPRGPKKAVKKGYVPGRIARRHISTAQALKNGAVA